jgi:hypothetical protein
VAIVFIQAVTQMFPFAMALRLNRRDVYLRPTVGACA